MEDRKGNRYKKKLNYLVLAFVLVGMACPPWRTELSTESCGHAYTEDGQRNCIELLTYMQFWEYQQEERLSTPDQYEPNDIPDTALCFSQEQSFPQLTLHSSDDMDYYKFHAASTDTIYEISGRHLSFTGLTVKLYDSDGIAVLAEKPVDSPDPIRHQFSQAGAYYFSIASGGDPVYYYLDFIGGQLGPCQ